VHAALDVLGIPPNLSAARRLGHWARRRLEIMRGVKHAPGCLCHLCGDSRKILRVLVLLLGGGPDLDMPIEDGQPAGDVREHKSKVGGASPRPT
jgi:hypothetical protein